MTSVAAAQSGKGHRDENFPVASMLIAPRHRPAVMAFYQFVRAADDVADNADLSPAEKHRLLDAMEAALLGAGPALPESEPLRRVLASAALPARHALDLLNAFRTDVDKLRYADWDDLLGYCALSAMPVGRWVCDVHGESQAVWPANDALCAALQIINHVQDCGKDFQALGRVYMPADALARHGAVAEDLGAARAAPALRAALADIVRRTKALLAEAAVFPAILGDGRLAMEVAAIHRLAERLIGRLETCDPLSERVHFGKAQAGLIALGGVVSAGARRWLRSGSPSAAVGARAP